MDPEALVRGHGVMRLEVAVPVVQSCRGVGELAVKYKVGDELVAFTLTEHRELWQHAIVAPNGWEFRRAVASSARRAGKGPGLPEQ